MKQDLRYIKTEKIIHDAFYQLLREKNIQKITVRDISERAMINKTTFYSHYPSLDDFYRALEQKTIAYVLDQITECTMLFENPEKFVEQLYNGLIDYYAVEGHIPYLQSESFGHMLNCAMKEKMKSQGIDVNQYANVGMLLSFLVSGLLGILGEGNSDKEAQLHFVGTFVKGGIQELKHNSNLMGTV